MSRRRAAGGLKRQAWASVAVPLLPLALAAACGGPDSSGGEALGYELNLTLRADGSVRVEERARVSFGETGEARFALTIPDERVDAVDTLAARIDGRPASGLDAELLAEPGGGFKWSAPVSAGSTREFELTYDARGVMAVRGARGVFVWPAVPAGRGPIGEATIRLTWPEGSVPMQGPAVGGEDWEVSVAATGAVIRSRQVNRHDVPPLYVDLVLADLSVSEPAWQVNELRARQLAPAFISAGLFMVVVAAGILIMVRAQHPPARAGAAAAPGTVPEEGRAELVGLRASRASPSVLEALASDGLVDRERIAIGRGLRMSGLVVLVAAIGVTTTVRLLMDDLGPAPYAVPAGLAISGAILYFRGVTFPILTDAGAEAAMLHSRRLQPRREL